MRYYNHSYCLKIWIWEWKWLFCHSLHKNPQKYFHVHNICSSRPLFLAFALSITQQRQASSFQIKGDTWGYRRAIYRMWSRPSLDTYWLCKWADAKPWQNVALRINTVSVNIIAPSSNKVKHEISSSYQDAAIKYWASSTWGSIAESSRVLTGP